MASPSWVSGKGDRNNANSALSLPTSRLNLPFRLLRRFHLGFIIVALPRSALHSSSKSGFWEIFPDAELLKSSA